MPTCTTAPPAPRLRSRRSPVIRGRPPRSARASWCRCARARPAARARNARPAASARGRELAQPEPAQSAADRRGRHAELAHDGRTADAPPAQSLDLGHASGRHRVGSALRRRAAVDERRPASAIARQPAVSLPFRQSRSVGGRSHRPALLDHPPHQEESTLRHQTGIFVQLHPGDLPLSAASVAADSLTRCPRMNNLHSNYR